MQADQQNNNHPHKSEIFMLDIDIDIDMNPSDENCIYPILAFIQNQAKSLSVTSQGIIFDRTLWLKAFEIANSKSHDIVICLGGNHTLINL